MNASWHIAIDLGSSTGRVFLARFNGQDLELIEAYRFAHKPVFQDNHWRWNWPYLRAETRAGLGKAVALAGQGKIVSLGCSSWAQDFVLLDSEGHLLENPICYRDEFTRGLPEAFADTIAPADLVRRTGCSISPITTLCKLKAMRNQYPRLLEKTKVLLHMADMVHFDLCGEAMTDWTLATAGQMFNLQNQSWDLPLLAQLDIPAHILPPVAMSPRVIGRVKPETSPHPALNNIPVVSTAHHDTACATVVLRPMQEGLFFISLGSYAMAGAVLNSACWSNAAKPEKQALIGIADRQWGLFAACAGLWIIQECRRIWHEQGVQIEYDRLAELAGKSNYRGGIDLKTARFAKPSNMVNEIKNVCRETGAGQPNEPGDIARLVFDSLAVGFECAVRDLEKAVQMPCRKLFLIGGGSRNRYLVRQITDRVGCDVVVGPAEATVVGNLTLQHEIIE